MLLLVLVPNQRTTYRSRWRDRCKTARSAARDIPPESIVWGDAVDSELRLRGSLCRIVQPERSPSDGDGRIPRIQQGFFALQA